jgi:hypothetical protein
VHAVLRAPNQLRADLTLEDRHLARDGGLREPDRVAGGRERSVGHDRAKGRQLPHIQHLGSFTGPPLVGALAEAGSLSAALGLLVVVSGAMILLAPRVPR